VFQPPAEDVTSDESPAVPEAGRRFGGVERLFGGDVMRRFAAAHIAVVGVGGVGSWAAEALARSGIGALTLIDLDHVAESNINRQLVALDSTLGKAKVQVLAERIHDINPACVVSGIEDFVTADDPARHLADSLDGVLECIDSFRVKAAIIAHCRRTRTAMVTVGGAGGRHDPTRVRVSDLSRTEQDALLARTRKQLRQQYGFPANPKRRFAVPAVWSDEPPHASSGRRGLTCAGMGSLMPVTAAFGLAAAAKMLERLAVETEAVTARGPRP
jgi:tRNA A37 threonylcarbamoyladenosine dehydratase